MKRKFAVFDIDGTLIRWQLYHALVDRLAKNKQLGPGAQTALHEARMRWKRREHHDAFREYEIVLIEVYEAALGSLNTQEFDRAVIDTANEYKEQVYTYTRDLIKRLKAKNYVLLAISGSHKEIVQHLAEPYGFDDIVGTEYVRENGTFTGKKILVTKDKKTALEKLIKKHNLSLEGSLAIGDSGSDMPMLEMVEQPIAFNPDKKLFEVAKQNGWQIVVERKNVIYTLEHHDGQYLLA